MKKKVLSLLLALTLTVGILPVTASAKTYKGGEKILGTFVLPEFVGEVDEEHLYYNQGDKLYAAKDAKEWYAYTVDTLELDLGDIAVDGREAIKKTVSIKLTNVGNMPITFINDTYDFAAIEGSPAPLHHYQQPGKTSVAPGESTTVDISLEVYPKRSYGKIYGPGYFVGYIGGHRNSGLQYTVTYNVVDGRDGSTEWQHPIPVGYGEVSWRMSEPTVDFGDITIDTTAEHAKTLTVANTGIVPIEVSGRIVATGVGVENCEKRGVPVSLTAKTENKTENEAESDWIALKSGQNAEFVLTPEQVGGRIEGMSVEFSLRYEYNDAEHTYTEALPILGNIQNPDGSDVTYDDDERTEPTSGGMPASWAIDDVYRAIELGILTPDLRGDYKQPITRAEFCKLAYCYWGAVYGNYPYYGYGETNFVDTDDPYVSAMSMVEVVNGYGDGVFDPDRPLTREQAATILSRLVLFGGRYIGGGEKLPDGEVDYADGAAISSWAVDAVGQVTAAGIMKGMGENAFAPKGSYTREQAIVTIMRLYDWVK